ncbi:ABC transporter permease [Ekhidna sp.]|uniref:ABC transporter permease n=1 Tax=Ekhidna sp. TaxID=2608089 RepID=UPI003296F296
MPPKPAEKFLLLFLKSELVEEVLGDLDEKFYRTIEKKSERRAKLNYWYQVFNYLRPFAFKFFKSNSIIPTMISHNFKISYRILLKNKLFSAINIGGLAMGMIVTILIGLWINDELSFNTYHKNYDQIVQVLRKNTELDGSISVNSSLVGQVGVFMKETYPAVFDQVGMTFFRSRAQLLSVGKQSFDKIGYFFQPDGPEMLSLEMMSGDIHGIDDRSSILLSQSLAKTFFGDNNPIGEVVNLNLQTDLKVAGVYKDIPNNSEFANATFMASMDLIYNEQNPYAWDNYNIRVYATLKDGVDLNEASNLIKNIMTPHRDSEDGPMELFLLPMKDWHLNAEFEDGIQVTSKRMLFVRLYATIGVFVLLLAFINFMNLNTARFQNRGKEVGIRKTVGSLRSQLITQFLAESTLYALASFILSIVIVWLILPWFNGISDKTLGIPWSNFTFWLTGILFTLLSAILAGSYPALFLSSFKPLNALSGTLKQGIASVRLRQGLVIFQFTISILLMIGTITVFNQIQHAKSRPVGYNQEDLITVRGRSDEFYEKYDVLRAELKRTGMVEEMAAANYPLMNTLGNNGGFSLRETGERIAFSFNTIFVSPEYGATTQWELIEGRDFSRDRDEVANVIISESAVKRMGLSNPIGSVLQSKWEFKGRKEFTVIGVVKDMIKGSPYEEPYPLMVFPTTWAMSFLFIRLNPEMGYVEALQKIQETFEATLPGHPFNYEFVDNEYSTKFRSEEKIGSLATFFSFLAILISCLGLFGLSAFVVEQRTKEIGIRKVLGASVPTLWKLLSKDFTVLVIISSALAIPAASFFLNIWLESYEYRIEITWWMYALAAASGFFIALLTVSYHSIRASIGNPIEALRSE